MKYVISVIIVVSLACTVQLVPTHLKALAVPTQEISPKPHPAPTPIRQTIVTASRSVNIREDASEHSKDIGDLWHGDAVIVVGCSGDWAKIGENMYVKSDYLGGICE